MKTLQAFWWNALPNFGDALTPFLLSAFSKVNVFHTPPAEAEVVVVGSVLEALPSNWTGIVAGAGKMYESTLLNLEMAEVYGLRGELSARGIAGDFTLGDPALLVDEMVPRGEERYELGIVPHWSDIDLVHRFTQYDPLIILPTQDPLTVVHQISCCKKIVASSLHGIIVADSYGIPRRAEMFTQAASEGGSFKFEDYSSAIHMPVEFGKLQQPLRWRIEELQRGLWDMFRRIGGWEW